LDNDTLLLAFVGVTAAAIVLQTIILLAVFLAVRKAARSIKEEVEDLRSSLMPIIHNTRDLFARLSPKVESTVDDLAEIAHGLRVQTAEVQSSALEIMEKMRRQTNRLDHMFTTVLDAVDRAGGFVAETVSRPVRQISALLSSIKAMIESLRTPQAEQRPGRAASERPPGDKDMFV
jgi:phage-related protein